MRRSLPVRATILSAAAALAVLAASCSSSSGGATVSDGKPESGGSVTYAVDTEPTSWNIHVSPQDITGEITRNVFDSLVSVDEKGGVHPWLATSWKSTADLKSYTFTLRRDVTFTDGTPFDAAAVKANFDHIVSKSTKSLLAVNLIGPYTGTDVIDRYTAKVNFSKPFAPFLQAASTSYLGFYSPKALTDKADQLAGGGSAAVGTGPFVFTSYTKGQQAVFTRNPAYKWAPDTAAHAGPAYLDRLTVRFLPESSVRVGALTSNQVQVSRAIPAGQVSTVKSSGALQLLRRDQPGGSYNLYLNASKAPFNDQRVRRAVQRGIDIATDVRTVYRNTYERAWSPISPTTVGYDASLKGSWPYDPALAGRLLDEAGWTGRDAQGYRTKDGKRLTVEWPLLPAQYVRDNRIVLGEAIQADLKKIGVEVSRPTLDNGTYVERAYGGKVDILDNAFARLDPDVLWALFSSASAPAAGGQNATFLADDQLDQWTEQGRATADPATRISVYGKVQQRAISLATVVPIYVPSSAVGAAKKVQGLTFDASTWITFHDAWITNS